jgi:hypothetical protein
MSPSQSKDKQARSRQGLQRALEGILERLRQGVEEIAKGLNPNRPQPVPIPIPVEQRRRR